MELVFGGEGEEKVVLSWWPRDVGQGSGQGGGTVGCRGCCG